MNDTPSTLFTIVLPMFVVASIVAIPTHAQSARAQLEVSGTSTVRGWTCLVEGAMEATAGESSAALPGLPNGLSSVTVTVEVEAFECPEEEMDEHLRDAMEVAEYPQIVFVLQDYSLDGDTAEASGTMTIHGTTNPITFEIELIESSEGIRGVGQAELNMTEFGVTPPSVFLGLLNVGEEITIEFDAPLPSL